MINDSGDMLYRSWWTLLEFWAGEIWRKVTILNFWPTIEMKTQGTLNTKLVDVLLSFPTSACMPCSDKQSNSYDQCKTARGKILTEIWEHAEFSKSDVGLVQEWNQDNKLKERRMLYDHSWSDCMQKTKWGTLELWMLLGDNDQRQGKAGSDRYDGSEIFSDQGCSLELTDDLEA
jgi:hypothetical protein